MTTTTTKSRSRSLWEPLLLPPWPGLLLPLLLALWQLPCSTHASCSDLRCYCSSMAPSRLQAAVCEIGSLQDVGAVVSGFQHDSLASLTLSCSGHAPGNLPDAIFAFQRRLVTLEVVGCHVGTVGSGYLSGLEDLETLTLRGLGLSAEELDDPHLVSRDAKKLRTLEATNCGLSRVPSLCAFQHLRQVNMSGNQISTMEDAGLQCRDDVTTGTSMRSSEDMAQAAITNSLSTEGRSTDTSTENETSSEESSSVNGTSHSGGRYDERSVDTTIVRKDDSDSDVRQSVSDVNSAGVTDDVTPLVSMATIQPTATYGASRSRRSNQESSSPPSNPVSSPDPTRTATTIVDLDLSSNPIASVPDWFPQTYPQLRSLRVADTNVTSLPDGLLSLMPRLEVLDCSGCPLAGAALSLGSNSALQTLRLSAANAMLPAGFLRELRSLVTLELDGVRLTTAAFHELEGSENVTTLRLKRAGLTELSPNATASMQHLQVLDLALNSIGDLDSDVFANNGQLRQLNLSFNALDTLPLNVLDSLTLLRLLDLRSNVLTRLPSSTFRNTPSLEMLFLSKNKLGFFARDTFRNLSLLHALDLMDNEIISVPDFSGLSRLLYLDLSDNRILSLKNDAFLGLPLLDGISLRGNGLSMIPLQAFRTNRNLYLVNLSHNRIRMLETIEGGGPFSSLHRLGVLRLDHNLLQDIRHFLGRLPSLKILFLNNNHILNISRGDLPPSLNKVSLAHNHLQRVGTMAFAELPLLDLVDLSFNYPHLKWLPKFSVQVHDRAKPVFDLAGNLFVCDCRLGYLKALDLAQREGDIFRPANMPTFNHLDYSYCAVYYDPVNVFRFNATPYSRFVCPYTSFCDLLCSCCQASGRPAEGCACQMQCPRGCKCFAGEFNHRMELHNDVFCLNWTGTSLPAELPYLASRMIVTGGNISTLPEGSFEKMEHLKVLELENSGIRSIQCGAFSGLKRLRHLSLEGNLLKELKAGAFRGLEDVEYMSLARGTLQRLDPEALRPLRGLKGLSLQGNRLSTLDRVAMEILTGMSNASLQLSDNPWSCGCHFITAFKDFVVKNAARIEDPRNLTCQPEVGNPFNASSIPVLEPTLCANSSHQVNATVLRSTFLDNPAHLAALVTLLIALSLIAAASAVLYFKRHEIQAMLFARFGLRLPFARKVDDRDPKRVFDAFVSYSSQDEQFVLREVMPRLEGGHRKYKLCLHFRDFPVGAAIADNIIDSIESSKRTVLLLSRHFLSSEWCSFERQTAHHHALKQGQHRLVLVLLEDLKGMEIEPELQAMLQGGTTTLRVDEPLFWEKLCLALPDVPVEPTNNEQNTGDQATEMQAVVDGERVANVV